MLSFTFFFFLQLLALFAQNARKPVLLTGKWHRVKQSIEYNAPDQCLPYIRPNPYAEDEADRAKAFGISFLLPKAGGSCDDGLTICFPGSLDSVTGGIWPNMVALGRFRVKNDENEANEATRFCAEKWRIDGKGKGSPWHGIFIHTQKIGDGRIENLNKRRVLMKMSISSKEYDFGTVRQFSMRFGSRADPFTFVTLDNGVRFSDRSDDVLREVFLRTVPRGALLRDFVGLWMLGLDILPFTYLDNIELYTYRGCNCTMEAWFTSPTDSENPSMGDLEVSAGSENCSHLVSQQSFVIEQMTKIHEEKDYAIRIKALTDEEMSEIEVNLTDANQRTIMAFSIGTVRPLKVEFPNVTYDNNFATLPNGSYTMLLWVALLKNSYAIQFNETVLDNRQFWPTQWWKGSGRENVRHVVLSGQMLLLEEPTQNEIEITEPVKLNYTKFYQQMCIGSTFLFRVQLRKDKSKNCAGNFAVALLHNRPEHHKRVGSEVFAVKIRPCDNQFDFTIHHFGTPSGESRNFFFNTGDQREYEFQLYMSNTYKFFVNGSMFYEKTTNITPAWAINFVRVEGDVNLLEEPFVNLATCEPDKNGTSMELKSVLNYGEIVKIEGRVASDAKMITIYLFHEVAQYTPRMGDVLLQLVFDFKKDQIKCIHKLYAETEWVKGRNRHFKDLKVYKSQKVKLLILMADDGFYGSISDTNFVKFCDYYKTDNLSISKMPFPPFSIDFVRIEGDLNKLEEEPPIEPIQIIAPNETTQYKDNSQKLISFTPLPYKQINRTDGLLQVGEKITVLMTLKEFTDGEKQEVGVFFYNQAIGYHDLIGKNVLKILFNNESLIFGSTYPLEWNVSLKEETVPMRGLLKPNTVLKFTITVMAISNFKLVLSGKDKNAKDKGILFIKEHSFEQKGTEDRLPLPAWATQYITTTYTGMTTPVSQIFCKPESRCTMRKGEMAYEWVFKRTKSTN